MSKRIFTQLAAIVIVVMLVGACTTPAASTQAPTAQGQATAGASAGSPVEVTWWQLTSNDAQLAALEAIIAGFEAAHPGITVKLEQRAIDAHKEALRVALGTEAFPDIYFMWAGLGLGGEFVNAGASAPLAEAYLGDGVMVNSGAFNEIGRASCRERV